ncbi:MAG: hypothetical protein C4K47_04600 [Candidatus Thorarchaeota archaeon]|nr:MAG: hypothetical protein C4K47_04600 [Candidatus Thorarchaeota archaeon]
MKSVASRLRQLKTYSYELGLDLGNPDGRFEWFLASILFAKRISTQISRRTFVRFREEGLTTPDAILEAGWDKLVEVLDSGGYTRYDFSTASALLDIMGNLRERYGSLEAIHAQAESSRDLETKLMEFRGVGPIGVNIFLRELRGIWEKANPNPSKLAIQAANKLDMKRIDKLESQLVRLYIEYCKKRLCSNCPVRSYCSVVK